MYVWGWGDVGKGRGSVGETQAEESEIVEGKRKMWRERVPEEGKVGRREINQFNKEPVIREPPVLGGLCGWGTWHREADLDEAVRVRVKQRPGFYYHQMVLSPLEGAELRDRSAVTGSSSSVRPGSAAGALSQRNLSPLNEPFLQECCLPTHLRP